MVFPKIARVEIVTFAKPVEGNRAMGDRSQDLRIEPCIAGNLLRIHRIALPVAV
jgi:hypothetical protein